MFKTFVSRSVGGEFPFCWLIEEFRLLQDCVKWDLLIAFLASRAGVQWDSLSPLLSLALSQVLLPPPGEIPPSPPGLQEQLSTVASFSTFQELLEVSSRGEHSCHCHNSLQSKCHPVLGDLNWAAWKEREIVCVLLEGSSRKAFEQPESYIIAVRSLDHWHVSQWKMICLLQVLWCLYKAEKTRRKERLFAFSKLLLCQPGQGASNQMCRAE